MTSPGLPPLSGPLRTIFPDVRALEAEMMGLMNYYQKVGRICGRRASPLPVLWEQSCGGGA